jgi:hypothetical protein
MYIRALCVGRVIALCARNVCYLMIVHAHAQLVSYFAFFCRQWRQIESASTSLEYYARRGVRVGILHF